jgi:hypothetical protein
MKNLVKRTMMAVAAMLGVGGCTTDEISNANAVGQGFVGLFNLAGDGITKLVQWITTGTLLICLMLEGGCAEKVITATDQMMQNNATPIVTKVLETQAVQGMIVQGNAQMINPNLHIRGTAYYVQGIQYDFNIGVDGAATNLSASGNSVNKDYNFSVVPTTTSPATSQPAAKEE